ncbi:hypothetical protein [Streptantibioticus ferralitis]|uniref:Uncharacterized protein n=1 Tax=Streptantibioticus ferralitis TaxID=236510 RepID=A0ABT5ZCB4_9ACTN|nr:hypothetical protein [Streptantibioticus ferralitis]MDF2261491.1 hypothetical protein [Streptantibioticus ferralitis]
MAASDEVSVPPQDRVRGDDQVERPQSGARQLVEERSQEGAVRRGDAWPVDLPLQDRQLVAQRQYFDVLVGVAHWKQPYEGEDARHGEVGQSQQHDRSA